MFGLRLSILVCLALPCSSVWADLWADYSARRVTRFDVVEFQPDMRSPGSYKQAGPVRTIARNPRNRLELTVATTGGGLFRTNDGGTTWRHLRGLPTPFTKSVAYDPNDPQVMLATSDEDWRNPPTGGIWRSTDRGETWFQPATGRLAGGSRCEGTLSAYAVTFDPSRRGRAFVASNCGILVTTDSGTTWRRTSTPGDVRFAAVLALRGDRAVAGGEAGLYYSRDGGATWTQTASSVGVAGDMEMHAFAASPFLSSHVLATTRDLNIYESYDDGRTWRSVATPGGGGGGCGGTSFIKAVPTPAREIPTGTGTGRSWMRLYYGDKCGIAYKDGPSAPGMPSGFDWSRSWVRDYPCHDDTHDLALSGSTPLMLATDGGVEKQDGTPQGSCRNPAGTWRLVGGAVGGLGALQITDVAGHQLTDETGAARRYDLYFGTQHTSLWGSQDLGRRWDGRASSEGGSFQIKARSTKEDARVVYFTCADCSINYAKTQFREGVGWTSPNAPGDVAGVYGYPFLVARPGAPAAEHSYVQHGYDTRPANQGFYLTQDFGSTWRRFADLDPTDRIGGIPLAYEGSDPGFYNPVIAPGPSRFALIQVRSVYRTPMIVRPRMMRHDTCAAGASSDEVVRLATFGSDFYWYPIYAVDPFDPNHLIAGDASGDGSMVESRDGGDCWRPMPGLTRLVTGGGVYRFWRGIDDEWRKGLVSLISFNPKAPGQVIVGGQQGGLFYSSDGGANWRGIPASAPIVAAKWAHWMSSDIAVVGSYGRGLWKVSVRSEIVLERIYEFCRRVNCALIALPNGASVPIGQARFDAAIMTVSGRVEDATIVNGRLAELVNSGGSDRLVYAKVQGAPSGTVLTERDATGLRRWKALAVAERQGVPIGVLTLGGAPVYLVTANNEVARPPVDAKAMAQISGRKTSWYDGRPSVTLVGDNNFFGSPIFTETDGMVGVQGSGFATGTEIEIWHDGRIAGREKPGPTGRFEARIPVARSIGRHVVEVRPSPGGQAKPLDSASYVVKPHDD